MIPKEELIPIIEQKSFVNVNGVIWQCTREGNKYIVDMKNQEVCRAEGELGLDRIYEDKDDVFLCEIQALCSVNGCSDIPEEHTSVETIEPEELTQEQRLKVAEMVQDKQCDKKEAMETITGKKEKRLSQVQSTYTPEQVNTIRNTVAKGANDDELSMFMHIAQTYGLDPFMKEIFYSSQMKTIMTSRDGYLKIAQRDHNFDGLQSMAVCENDDFSIDMKNNLVNHSFGKGDRGKVIGAWAICYHKERKPVIAYASYDEYNKGNNIWNTYKSAMCCKVAEAFSLKRQFGISGLVTQEEIE